MSDDPMAQALARLDEGTAKIAAERAARQREWRRSNFYAAFRNAMFAIDSAVNAVNRYRPEGTPEWTPEALVAAMDEYFDSFNRR